MVSVCLPSDALSQYLPSSLGFSYPGHGVSLHGCSSKAQLPLLTLNVESLLSASCAHAGSPGGSAGYKSACNVGDLGLIPVLGRSLREEKGYLLQYSGLENSMDCIVHGDAKSWTRLSDFHFH